MAFFEDINQEILGEYLTDEQLAQINAMNCIAGVSTGDSIIIGLLSLLSEASGTCCNEPQELTSGASITFDLSLGTNATLLLENDAELQIPVGAQAICTGIIIVEQGEGGGNELTLATGYFVSAGSLDDINAGDEGDKFQISWCSISETEVNVTILPLQ